MSNESVKETKIKKNRKILQTIDREQIRDKQMESKVSCPYISKPQI